MFLYVKRHQYSIVLFVELFLLMPYQYIKLMPYVYDTTIYLKYFALFMEIVLFIAKRETRYDYNLKLTSFSYAELSLVAFVVYEFLISFIKNSIPMTRLTSYVTGLLLLLLALKRNFRNNYIQTLHTLSLFFWMAIFLNFVSLIAFPDGLYTSRTSLGAEYTNYFLGLDNAFGMFLFPGFALISFSEEKTSPKKVPVLSITSLAMMLYTYLITLSGSGLVATIILIVLYVVYKTGVLDNLISLKIFMIVTFLLSLGLVCGSALIYTNNTISNIITSALGKDMSFSSRTVIWEAGLTQFMDNPLFGYGNHTADNIVYVGGAYRIAHNFWLQLLLEGGMIGFFIYCIFIYNTIQDVAKIDKHHREIKTLYIGILAIFIYTLMESGSGLIFVTLLFLVLRFASTYIYENCECER